MWYKRRKEEKRRALFRKKRAEPETEPVFDETSIESDPLLEAWINGEKLGRDKAMEIPAVSGCIDLIARTTANIPIKLYKRNGEKTEEVKGDRRIFLLNKETGDTMDSNQMRQALIRDYYLGKGGFCFVNWSGNEVESLHYVKSDNVAIASSEDVIFKKYAILVQGRAYFPEQFISLLRNSDDGMRGKSIVEENKKLISVAYNSLKYEEGLVKTGGNKKGFVKSTKKLTQEAINRLKRAWKKLYQSATENVVILNDGLEFQESSNTSVEMQLNENKKSNSEEFCKVFNIPPTVLSGGMTEQDEKNFIKYCINNAIGEFVAAINRALLLESEKQDHFFAADTYELTKGDIAKRYQAYKTAVETGWKQIDEIRNDENLPPIGMDIIKLGLQDVLYDPKTKRIYTPNTGKSASLSEGIDIGEGNELEK